MLSYYPETMTPEDVAEYEAIRAAEEINTTADTMYDGESEYLGIRSRSDKLLPFFDIPY